MIRTLMLSSLFPYTTLFRSILKYGLILYVVIINTQEALSAMKQYGDAAPRPPLYGIYNIETFIRNKDTIAALATDTIRWNKRSEEHTSELQSLTNIVCRLLL